MTAEKDIQEIHPIKLSEVINLDFYFERDKVAAVNSELARSMKEVGLINPITVVKILDSYCIVTGVHRVLAALALEWETIPAIIIKCKRVEEFDRARDALKVS